MFYSQFILAKKGPLGTIWIAAHLERKLRKNQVADTDIGVSVDSILFPDVPIALRLSSHLLLGVVRIYSRKVNYLFDDCSEALLKIKQAFRSTAVDLPPEESTAPYHSITLPETFDLDDFELPDNDILQGNYVDNHISTRDQITLQDTMDGVVYSTSQYGLDERFGDGDASQIGLDLDEELLLDKVTAAGQDGDSDADPQSSVKPMTPLEQDDISEEINETSEAAAVNSSAIQLESFDVNAEFVEYAEAPSTPGLVDEPNLSSVQEALVCDDHLESEDHNSNHLVATESKENALSKSDFHHLGGGAMDQSFHSDSNQGTVECPEENGYHFRDLEVNRAKPLGGSDKPMPLVSDCSEGTIGALDGSDKMENIQMVAVRDNPIVPSVEPQEVRLEETAASPSSPCYYHDTSDTEDPILKSCPGSADVFVSESHMVGNQASIETKIHNYWAAESASAPVVDVEGQACQEPKGPETLNSLVVQEEIPSVFMNMLKPCSTHLNQADISTPVHDNSMALNLQSEEGEPCSLETFKKDVPSIEMQGEERHTTNMIQSEENQILGLSLFGEIHANSSVGHGTDIIQSEENQISGHSLFGEIHANSSEERHRTDIIRSQENQISGHSLFGEIHANSSGERHGTDIIRSQENQISGHSLFGEIHANNSEGRHGADIIRSQENQISGHSQFSEIHANNSEGRHGADIIRSQENQISGHSQFSEIHANNSEGRHGADIIRLQENQISGRSQFGEIHTNSSMASFSLKILASIKFKSALSNVPIFVGEGRHGTGIIPSQENQISGRSLFGEIHTNSSEGRHGTGIIQLQESQISGRSIFGEIHANSSEGRHGTGVIQSQENQISGRSLFGEIHANSSEGRHGTGIIQSQENQISGRSLFGEIHANSSEGRHGTDIIRSQENQISGHSRFGEIHANSSEGRHGTGIIQSKENQMLGLSLFGEINANSRHLYEPLDNVVPSDNQLNNFMSSEMPAPEKLLSVPEGLYRTSNMLVQSTPGKEILAGSGVGAGNQLISGKKRSYTESTLTVESLNSSESFWVNNSKRTSGSAPGDNDLLSSILVGKSSVLKMKPTPPVPVSRKRGRPAGPSQQTRALKRKVLMDDAMVLHGDMIRQQLTSTEDIRRIRKKAPCTSPEILTIQIQFMADEIFSEPILTGMSAELMSLHCEAHDLSRIRVSGTDENFGSSEVARDVECIVSHNTIEEGGMKRSTEPVVFRDNVEAQPAGTPIQTFRDSVEAQPAGTPFQTFRDNVEAQPAGTPIQTFRGNVEAQPAGTPIQTFRGNVEAQPAGTPIHVEAQPAGTPIHVEAQPAGTPIQAFRGTIEARLAGTPIQAFRDNAVAEARPAGTPIQAFRDNVEARPTGTLIQSFRDNVEAQPAGTPIQSFRDSVEAQPAGTPIQSFRDSVEAQPAGTPIQVFRDSVEAQPAGTPIQVFRDSVEAQPAGTPIQSFRDSVEAQPVGTPIQVFRDSVEAQPAGTPIQVFRDSFEAQPAGTPIQTFRDSFEAQPAGTPIQTFRDSFEAQPAGTPIESQEAVDHHLGSHDIDTLGHINTITDIAEMQHDPLAEISEMDIDRGNFEVADVPYFPVAHGNEALSQTDVAPVEICNMPAEDKLDGGDASLQMDTSCLTPEQKVDTQPVEEDDAMLVDISNERGVDATEVAVQNVDSAAVETESKSSVELLLEEGKVDAVIENGTDFQTDCTAPTEGANTVETSSVEAGGCNNTASADDDHSKLGVLNKDGVLAADLACDEKDPSCNNAREEPIMDSRASIENNVDLNNASLDDGENPAFQEVDLQNATITSFDQSVAEDRAEFEDITAGHDTEFLNVNDDEVDDDYDDDGMEADDDTRLLENSGWSSRTRAVSKYLQTLFDKEAEHGRNVLAMNQLLAGKTRKEASRMFFESLVLKTKDYIHVEQEQPFDNIKIMPRSKLMKSNF